MGENIQKRRVGEKEFSTRSFVNQNHWKLVWNVLLAQSHQQTKTTKSYQQQKSGNFASLIHGTCVISQSDSRDLRSAQIIHLLMINFSFNQAREACQAKGGQWDLVVFESDEELEYVKKLINCLPEAFWVGYRENNGVAIDILNKVKRF